MTNTRLTTVFVFVLSGLQSASIPSARLQKHRSALAKVHALPFQNLSFTSSRKVCSGGCTNFSTAVDQTRAWPNLTDRCWFIRSEWSDYGTIQFVSIKQQLTITNKFGEYILCKFSTEVLVETASVYTKFGYRPFYCNVTALLERTGWNMESHKFKSKTDRHCL